MICPWSSVSLPPIGVPSDYELGVDWPLVLPDLPNDDDDEEPDQDDIAFATFEENECF